MTRRIWLAAAGAAMLSTAPAAHAQQTDQAALEALDAQLPGTLISDPTRLDWERQGENVSVDGLVDAAIPGGGAANRYTVRRAGPQPYSAQASVPLIEEIRKGDVVTIGFWARSERADTSDGQGSLGVRVQLNQDPWPGFADTTVPIGSEWKWHEVSATATTDMRRGSGILAFHLAGARQTIDIGQTIVVKGAPSIAGAEPAAAPQAAATAELPEPLRAAGRLVNDPARRGWRNVGPAGAWQDRAEPAVWLGQATRFTSAAADSGAIATTIPLGTPVTAGDKLLIAIVARTESATTDDGRALVGIRVQDGQPPHAALANAAFKVGPTWQLIRVPVTAGADLPADRAEIVLDFARAPQAVDIGPVYVLRVE